MSKINFDFGALQNSVIPSIESAVANLNNGKDTINSTFVPYDCAYADYIKSLSSKLITVSSNLNRVKNWINSSNNAFEGSLNNSNSNLRSIEVVQIERK